ncbi:MAG: NAD-dependent epimerase/dehydratase family protein, partial [Polynucleobacter sp.]|nr:NAD-dependent epimerase/dehydratase family protein [Polynucleobacter sp.]
MRVLITGGGGMVGRNLLTHPSSKHHEILSPSRSDLDLRNYAATELYIDTNRPDIVIHSAGRVGGIQANMMNSFGFLVENLDIGRNIVLACAKVGIPRLINLGSSCMYPRNAQNPLQEELVLTGEL